jgi:SAM-dependent methyltransferase
MKNKDYWNQRAKKNKNSVISTTNFELIKEFEIAILKHVIKKYTKSKNLKILELGCGNGVNLLNIKKLYPHFKLYGIDYSEEMIRYAKNKSKNINFFLGDITKKDSYMDLPKFDIIFTNRCLINLKSQKKIHDVITKSKNFLKNGGHYIFLENFTNGHVNKNKLRIMLNLKPRKIASFNRFINETHFLRFLKKTFKIFENVNYSSLNDLFLYVLLPKNSTKINYNSPLQKKLILLLIKYLDKNNSFLKLNQNTGQNNLIVCKK